MRLAVQVVMQNVTLPYMRMGCQFSIIFVHEIDYVRSGVFFKLLNAELNPFCHLLTLLGVHHLLHVNRIRVKSLSLRLLMSYIWSTYS